MLVSGLLRARLPGSFSSSAVATSSVDSTEGLDSLPTGASAAVFIPSVAPVS